MSILKKPAPIAVATPETFRAFIGKSWVNKISKAGKYFGVKYLTITKDKGVKITIDTGKEVVEWSDADKMNMILFPNAKRNGKKDADFRLSIVSNDSAKAPGLEEESPF